MNNLIPSETDIQAVSEYIFLKSRPERADIALIFGTGSYEGPLSAVVPLYKEGRVPKILISGGVNRHTGHNEAAEISALLVDRGVSERDIIIEDKSTNTLENVLFSRNVIDHEIGLDNVRKIIVVVKNYHSRRVLMTMKRHFPEHVEVVPVTYNLFNFDASNWHQDETGRKKVSGELERIKKYLAKGDIAEL
jgi:uncharacterized SAM-binding protein YcdF (DUF218 family)